MNNEGASRESKVEDSDPSGRAQLVLEPGFRSNSTDARLHLLIGLWDGLHSVPPHPGPLPGERENGPPTLDHTRAGVCQITIGKTPIRRKLFRLPEGEGQGEGNTRSNTQSVPYPKDASVSPHPKRQRERCLGSGSALSSGCSR